MPNFGHTTAAGAVVPRAPQPGEEAGTEAAGVATALRMFTPDGRGRAGWPLGSAVDVDPDHPFLGWLEACERRGLAERGEDGRWRLTWTGLVRRRALTLDAPPESAPPRKS